MVDYSKLSDAELDAVIAREKNGPAPVTAKGSAKAFGSGALHEGVPAMVGMGGDVSSLYKTYGVWAGDKLRNLFNPPDYSKMTDAELEAQIAKEKGTPEARKAYVPPPIEFTDPNGEGPKQLAEIKAAHAAGTVPTEAGAGVQFRSSFLPTSGDIKGAIKTVVPEYMPQNKTEDVLKTAGSYAPGLGLAPEVMAANSLRSVGKAALTAPARYMAAPTALGEGARELPYIKGSKYEEPVAAAASLIAPTLASKMITRNPMTDPQLRARSILERHGVGAGTPGQLTEDVSKMRKEARIADAPFTGNSAEAINQAKTREYTAGALRHVGWENDPTLRRLFEAEGGMTAPVRAHIAQGTAAALAATRPQRGPGGRFLRGQPSAPALAQQEAQQILEAAARKSPSGQITPKALEAATRSLPDTHPLSRYSNAGVRLLPDLKGKTGDFAHNALLALILAGGAGYGTYEGTKTALGEYGGYGSGLLAGSLAAALHGRGYHSRPMQKLLTNQVLPKALQPGPTRDAAHQLMAAEAAIKLAKQHAE